MGRLPQGHQVCAPEPLFPSEDLANKAGELRQWAGEGLEIPEPALS